jgi:small subunit ribosomal protein S17
MAEKTTTKKAAAEKPEKATKTTAKATATKTAAAKAPAKTAAAKKTTERATASATRPKTATAERATAAASEKAAKVISSPAALARQAVTVRKRTAATVAHTASVPGEQSTGWRRFHRKTKVGVVTSAKQPKTVIVTVGRMREHPLYKKVIRLRKGFAAHDEAGDVREGDLVRIQESRPFSATKRWLVVEVLSRAGEAGAAAPRVEDVAGQLERSEGVSELFEKPEREEEDAEEGAEKVK